jgi:hypothetical protein
MRRALASEVPRAVSAAGEPNSSSISRRLGCDLGDVARRDGNGCGRGVARRDRPQHQGSAYDVGNQDGREAHIHVNLGRATALINAATDTVYAAMAETDARIAIDVVPTDFRQTSASMQAVLLCDEAMSDCLLCQALRGR